MSREMYAPTEELEAFCRVAASADKPVTVHLKALSRMSPTYPPYYFKPHNVRALKEMIAIARKTGVRLQVSHLIFVGRNTWSTAEPCIRMIEDERARGMISNSDAFPIRLGIPRQCVSPSWFLERLPRHMRTGGQKKYSGQNWHLDLSWSGFHSGISQIMDAGVINGRI
ncbi:MAG: hypothetical protein R2875_13250 [Desulfobacterales bacterium]